MKMRSIFFALFASASLCAMVGTACAQIFVTRVGSSLGSPAFISEYTTSGTLVNPELISGLTHPGPIAVSDGNLFVVDQDSSFTSHIGLYTTSGATVNARLIIGLAGVADIAVSGGFLYVSGLLPNGLGTVIKYTTSGTLVNRLLISRDVPEGIAVSGDHLFVTFPSINHDRVGEYTTSGQAVNRNLITDVTFPESIAVSGENLFLRIGGNSGPVLKYTLSGELVDPFLIATFQVGDIAASGDKLFVQNLSDNTISEYTTAGNVVNRALISPPGAFAVVPGSERQVPDTGSTCLLLLLGLTATVALKHLHRRA